MKIRYTINGAALAAAIVVMHVPVLKAANIAAEGTAIMGLNDAVDGDEGMPFAHFGAPDRMIDGDPASSEDTWTGGAGGDQGNNFSYAGVVWSGARTDQIFSLKLTHVTFPDGGWFGPAGTTPGAGNALAAAHLIAPVIQVSSDGGVTWTDVPSTSDYLTVMEGHRIGGGSIPNPSRVTASFLLTPPVTGVDAIRIIGENGGNGENGFLGVAELVIESIEGDSDDDGMDDAWEIEHGLTVGVDDSASDAGDSDGLSNLDEFRKGTDPNNPDTDGDGLADGAEVHTHGTNPALADTDGDGLNDGAEVNTHLTNPLAVDTDGDTLNDGQEVNVHGTNPLVADSDGDGFTDGVEVRLRSNPAVASSIPANIAPLGTIILGTSTGAEGGVDTPHAQAGTPANLNDADLNTRVDTFGRTDPETYVGVIFPEPRTVAVDRVEATFVIFADGGWFGPNGSDPGGPGTLLSYEEGHLSEPLVQVTTDGGTTWTTVEASSNYIAVMNGHPLPAVNGGQTSTTAIFQLQTPQAGINGIRLIGSEGGTASGGFLGFYEFAVKDVSTSNGSNLAAYGTAIIGVSDEVDGLPGRRYANSGVARSVNDENYTTRVDTFNGPGAAASFVGILWPAPVTAPVKRIETVFSLFTDGGWFGPNGENPSAGEGLQAPTHLTEPSVQVTTDGGFTWETVPHSSTYIPALTNFRVPGLASPNVVFTLGTPRSGINGIRLIGPEGGSGSAGFLGIYEMAVRGESGAGISGEGTAILGTAVPSDTGFATRQFAQFGTYHALNDGNAGTRDTTFDGAAGAEPVSYVGMLWPGNEPVSITSASLSLASFRDGGWFGPAGTDPGAGGALASPDYLSAPIVQVTDDGLTWRTVEHVTDYLTVMEGHGIGGGGNPEPTSSVAHFTLNSPAANVTGIRVIGDAGGTGSGGFLAVNEIVIEGARMASGGDSDGDGQPDADELIAGTNPHDASSVLRLSNVTLTAENTLALTWNSVPGKSYRLMHSENLVSWQDGGRPVVPASAAPAGSTSSTISLPASVPGQLHFRVEVVTP